MTVTKYLCVGSIYPSCGGKIPLTTPLPLKLATFLIYDQVINDNYAGLVFEG
jgi:hypothetical protein